MPMPPGPGQGWLRLDPRTTSVLVIAVAAAMSLPSPEPFLPVAVTLVGLLLCSEPAWRRLAVFLALVVLLTLLAYVLPTRAPHPVTAVVGYTSAYLLRFVLVAGVSSHLIATTPPGRLAAALRAARIPRVVVVPLVVTLRFLPVVAGETRAVWESMRLRGLISARRPVRTVEWLTVPAIASTLRVGEDLAASALLRGLGGGSRPTSMHHTRLGPSDALVLAGTGLLTVLSWGLLR